MRRRKRARRTRDSQASIGLSINDSQADFAKAKGYAVEALWWLAYGRPVEEDVPGIYKALRDDPSR